MKEREIANVRRETLCDNGVYVSCSGEGKSRSGGLTMMWKSSLEMKLKAKS